MVVFFDGFSGNFVQTVVREAIHIRINNLALNHNTGKLYIPEIFNHLFEADTSSNESDQMVDSDLPQGQTYLTFPINRFSTEVCIANKVA